MYQSHPGQQSCNSLGTVTNAIIRQRRSGTCGLRQPDEVAEPPPGVRASDAEEAGKRLRKTAGKASPSREVPNASMHLEVESRKRAADTATEDTDGRIEGNEGTADDDVTTAAGQVSAGHGDGFDGWEAIKAKDT